VPVIRTGIKALRKVIMKYITKCPTGINISERMGEGVCNNIHKETKAMKGNIGNR